MGFGVPKLVQPQGRPTARPVPPKGAERPLIPTRSWEDEDAGWGGSERGGRDDELKRDRPPHWGQDSRWGQD